MAEDKGFGFVGFFVMFLVVLTIGLVVLDNVFDTAVSMETNTSFSTGNLTGANASTATLTLSPVTLNATVTNSTWLNFDGSGDSININSFGGIDIQDQSEAFSIWFNTSAGGLTNRGLAGVYQGFDLGFSNYTNLFCDVLNSSGYSINITYPVAAGYNDSLWHNVICNWNRSDGNLSLYFDGVLVNSKVELVNDSGSGLATSYIGLAYSPLASSFNGSLDEVRHYVTAGASGLISPTIAAEIYSSGRTPNWSVYNTSLLDWLPLNEGVGTNAHDILTGTYAITGTTWANDNINVSLVNNTDYTISDTTFTLVNKNYAWTSIILSYGYDIVTTSSATSVLRIVGILIALVFLTFLLGPILKKIEEFKTTR